MHDELLQHRVFLERLARCLVTDEAAAQDLVQETWLRALRRPPREIPALRGWLDTVARRLAGEGRRSGARRAQREGEVARAEATDGGLAAVDQRLDFQALLLERLRALPSEQRHALALRYVEDLAPSTIAARLGISVHTVKARLRRGLATLREELDRRAGGDRATWAVALLPELARQGLPAVWVQGGAAALVGGGILMTTGTKVAVALLAAGALVWGWWLVQGEGVADPPGPAVSLAASAGALEPPAGDVPAAIATTPDGIREALDPSTETSAAAAADASESSWRLRVEVGGTFGEAFGGAPALILVRGRWDRYQWPEQLVIETVLERPGEVILDVSTLVAPVAGGEGRVAASALVVEALHPACVSARADVLLEPGLDPDRPPASALVARLALHPGAVILGRIEPAEGDGTGVLVLAIERTSRGWAQGPVATTSPAADGSFRMVVPRGGTLLVGAARAGLRPLSRIVDARLGAEVDLGPLRFEGGATIEGQARHGGALAAEHTVTAQLLSSSTMVHAPNEHFSPLSWLNVATDALEWGNWVATADDHGRFRIEGLIPGGTYRVRLDRPLSFYIRAWALHSSVESNRIVAPAEGVVLDGDWSTLELVLQLPDETVRAGTLNLDSEDRPIISCSITTDLLPLLLVLEPDSPLTLELELDGFETERLEVVAPPLGGSEVVHLTPRPGRGPAKLELVLSGPLPPEGTQFLVHDLADPIFVRGTWIGLRPQLLADPRARSVRLEGGRLVLDDLKQGQRRLLIYAGQQVDRRSTYLLDVELELDLASGERIERGVELIEGGRLRLDVTDADGRRASARVELLGPAGEAAISFIAQVGEQGYSGSERLLAKAPNDVVPNLPAGRYRLRLELEGHQGEDLDVEILPGEQKLVAVQMRR